MFENQTQIYMIYNVIIEELNPFQFCMLYYYL